MLDKKKEELFFIGNEDYLSELDGSKFNITNAEKMLRSYILLKNNRYFLVTDIGNGCFKIIRQLTKRERTAIFKKDSFSCSCGESHEGNKKK